MHDRLERMVKDTIAANFWSYYPDIWEEWLRKSMKNHTWWQPVFLPRFQSEHTPDALLMNTLPITHPKNGSPLICNVCMLHMHAHTHQIFLYELRPHNSQKCGWGLVSNCLGQQSLPSTWWSIQNNSFGRFNAHFFVIFWMGERKLHRFLNLLDLCIQT